MSKNEDLLPQLEKLLKRKRGKKFYAEKLNITEEEVNSLMKELKQSKLKDSPEKYDEAINSFIEKVNKEKGTRESVIVTDFEPKDDIELAKLHRINLDKYVITNYWSKQQLSGKFTSSVSSKLKRPEDYSQEDFSNFLKNYTAKNVKVVKLKNKSKEFIDVELSISDFHIAKRCVEGDNNLEKRIETFYNISKDLIHKASSMYSINKIVFPIGNDFFHTDNYQNQTTQGTPQDVITEYDSEYEAGFDLLVTTINMLRHYCDEVEVVLVQGNHDKLKSFYLAHALDVFFSKTSDISFIRHHSTTKGIVLGNTFIGYHHGNCKIEDLPLLFATDPLFSSSFGDSKYREIHTGDKHHYMAKEVKGVRIQQMPSLSGTDRWHRDSNYVNSVRAALLLGYDANEGKVLELEKRI